MLATTDFLEKPTPFWQAVVTNWAATHRISLGRRPDYRRREWLAHADRPASIRLLHVVFNEFEEVVVGRLFLGFRGRLEMLGNRVIEFAPRRPRGAR